MPIAPREWPPVSDASRELLDKGEQAENDLRLREALTYYTRALELEPNNPSCIAAVAGILGRLGDWDRFVELERRLLQFFPEDVLQWMGLGNALLSFLHRPLEAVEAFRKAVELDGATLAPRLGLIQSLSAAQKHEEAISHAEEALRDERIEQRAKERAFLYEVYGDALFRAVRKSDAAEAYGKALDLRVAGDPRRVELQRKERVAKQTPQ